MGIEQQSSAEARPGTEAVAVDVATARMVGAAAIALALSFVIQNSVVAGAPTFGDPTEKVLTYHAQNRGAVSIAVGLEALNLPLLLGFLTGLHGMVARRSRVGTAWSRLAVAAGATLAAIFAFYAVLWIGVVLAASHLTEPSPTFQLVWQLHAAAFALAMPALGTTFIGAALAGAHQRADPALAAMAGAGGWTPAVGRRGGQPRDRRWLATPVRRDARLRRLAGVAAGDRCPSGSHSASRSLLTSGGRSARG